MFRPRRLVVVLAGAAIVAAIAIAVRFARHRPTAMERLITSASALETRPTEARVCGFPYAPLPRTKQRSGSSANLAFRAVTSSVIHEPTSDARIAAVAQLLNGHADVAVSVLESLRHERDGDDGYWSDLAAARYEAARRDDDTAMYLSALAAADRAIELRSRVEAVFNRGLALEALGLRKDAADTYRHYLKLDGDSAWASEVRQRLQQTSRPAANDEWQVEIDQLSKPGFEPRAEALELLTRRFPQYARTWAEGVFLGQWADAYQQHDAAAAERWLGIARIIGSGLRRTSGEQLLADAVATIDNANEARRARLAAAHVTYRNGRIALSRRQPTKALPLLGEAEREFADAGSPMSLMAAYFRANAAHDAHQASEAGAILQALQSAPQRYKALHAQLLWLQAIVHEANGRIYDVLNACRAAVSRFDDLGEVENATRMRSMHASLLAILGNGEDAWRLHGRALRDAAATGLPSLLEVVLHNAARDAIRARQWEQASALLQLELSHSPVSARLRADALIWRAFVALSDRPAAFDVAKTAAATLTDPVMRQEVLDELRFAQALHAPHEPKQAVEAFTSLIDSGSTNARPSLVAALYFERARAYRQLGQPAEAERDLRKAIEVAETAGAGVETLDLRDSAFGVARDYYSDLVDLLINANRPSEAFEIADRSRARVIAERQTGQAPDSSLQALQRRLPADVTLAHYTVLDRRVIVFVMTADSWRHEVVASTRSELETLRDELLAAIARDDTPATEHAASELYRRLLAPVMKTPTRRLIIVPDSITAAIPFAALRGSDGRWAVEHLELSYAPSAATWTNREIARPAQDVAILADPAFDRSLFPNLARLPAAARDAVKLKAVYPHAVTFAGDAATRDRALQSFAGSDIVHLATHAVSDPRDARQSMLLLAPSGTDRGILYSREIALLELRHAPLIVLAGCRTGALGGGTGSIRSLALAFLTAGSRAVLSTLWDVDDERTSLVSSAFHRGLTSGHSPAAALRAAQLEAISARQPVRHWAGFQIHVTTGN